MRNSQPGQDRQGTYKWQILGPSHGWTRCQFPSCTYSDPIYSRQNIHKRSSQPMTKDGSLDHGMIACLWKLLGVSSLQIFSLVFIIYEPYIFFYWLNWMQHINTNPNIWHVMLKYFLTANSKREVVEKLTTRSRHLKWRILRPCHG